MSGLIAPSKIRPLAGVNEPHLEIPAKQIEITAIGNRLLAIGYWLLAIGYSVVEKLRASNKMSSRGLDALLI